MAVTAPTGAENDPERRRLVMMNGTIVRQYEILERLGEGGMGVVYKARDTTLDRFVALKFLPDHVSSSPRDVERFRQEAKAAAALNHPNICTIYGIEEADGRHFIAMELVDGQTLHERMPALSLKKSMEIGIQIAEGLAAAHEKGIVHRDIKPENIMIRKDGIPLIMDFGLAKLQGVSRLTKEGSTVGTAGYMSPEQVQGQEADHRSDIFSLGVLLFEMITKQLPFKGIHETAIAYEIVNVDSPPMSTINPEIPPELDAIILECLEKDPNERTQSARQVAIDLKRYKRESSRQHVSRITAARPVTSVSTVQQPARSGADDAGTESLVRRFSRWIPVGIASAVMLAIGYVIALLAGPPPEHPPLVWASIKVPAGIHYLDGLGGHSSISPDGSRIAYVGTDSLGHSPLWIFNVQTNVTSSVPNTDHATYPFWSNDSRSVGFFADGKLKTVEANGGPVLELADAPFGRGAAWSSAGDIVYAPSVSDPNLYCIPSTGGAPRVITAFDSTIGYAPRFPSFLPDGIHFVFTMLALERGGQKSDLYVGSTEDRRSKKIVSGCSYGRYASGHLFYLRQGILVTQPFDLDAYELTGKPVSIHGDINSWGPRAKADFSVSDNGIVLFAVSGSSRNNELFSVTADGKETVVGRLDFYQRTTLSPDETMIAYDKLDPKTTTPNIWIYDLSRNVNSRLTFAQEGGGQPCWSRDGTTIFYNVELGPSKAAIFEKRSDGSGEEWLLVKDTANATVGYYPNDVSPDGKYLLLSLQNESSSELAYVELSGREGPARVIPLGIEGGFGMFSPDGKWIVYQSSAAVSSVSSKMSLSAFLGRRGTWQLPAEAGNWPHWGKGSIEYYSTTHDRYEQCDVSFSNGTPVFGEPKPLFPGTSSPDGVIFGVTRNGKKYYGVRPANAGGTSTLSVIVNWQGLTNKN